MKKYFLVMTGVALLAGSGVALAQMPPPGGPQGGPPPNGPEHHEEGMHHGEGMHHEGWMHHGRHEAGSAFFRFRRGDAEMDIKCPASETVQACVAAAGSLMDKVGAMQQPKTP